MAQTPEHLICIPTVDRPQLLESLLTLLRDQTDAIILVFDDGSTLAHVPAIAEIVQAAGGAYYYRQGRNGGRKEWWRLVNWMFQTTKEFSWEYLIFSADDHMPTPTAIEDLFRLWKSISAVDGDAGLMSLSFDKRIKGGQWGSGPGVDFGDVWFTNWVDMEFVAPRASIELLNFEINPIPRGHFRKRQSSGVGMQITHRLTKIHGKRLYHVGTSLFSHSDLPSRMHPVERKRNKLTSE